MSDIDAVIAARQFKESVPQHEADTKRKRDTPRSAVNAYKRKQAAIDKDVEADQKKAYLKRLLRDYSLGVSANDIGADKVRSETYVYHPYDEDYEPVPYWSDETEWGPELLKKVAQNTANRMTGKETDGVIYGHNEVKRPPAMTADDFVNGPQDTFAESQTDINARMSAWKQATDSPERTSEFLKAGGAALRDVNELAGTRIMGSGMAYANPDNASRADIPDNMRGDKGHRSANNMGIDEVYFVPQTYTSAGSNPNQLPFKSTAFDAMADAAAEEGPDDFEAQGVKHMKNTKKDRAAAVTPVVKDKDKVRGAEATGRYAEYNDKFTPTDATLMDIDVDTSSYLEGLMDKGLITPEEYVRARAAFRDGRARGRQDVAEEIAENQPRDY